ncbi:TonB-dependent receptor plug domain-containing protein [Sphingobium sp. B11D3D]|uniref:TonB-dependent receptor plug domain-containing protein n=1 Tax=Sphingobium sp. B11D3D TaxID=2940576 RepID=UPI0022259753|nr:TonB-dependent receptor [Sphingobium sp. B11D3D]MCW2370776.1 outer membrane receptor protein involved in Fe transport [Sphingobium sp. B11D3D]
MSSAHSVTARRVLTSIGLAALAGSIAQPAFAQADTTSQSGLENESANDAIIVTGSRLVASGFTAPTPVTVLGAELMQRQAVTNVADALNQIPSFRAQGSRATSGVFGNNVGAQTADLRGLGAARTLVLIDGRRVVASTVQGGSFTPGGVVDLSIIPTALVSRAEVVTGGASAAYGSDAVAGVVNIIIDDSLQGIRAQGQTEFSSRGDNEEYSLSLAGGTGFAGGRGHIVFGAEYIDSRGVRDCYMRSWCAQSYAPIQNATPGGNGGLPAVNILPNARTATASNEGLFNAGPLRGVAFDSAGNPISYPYGVYYGGGLFMSGGGTYNKNPFFEHFPLVAPLERYNLFGNMKFEVSDGIEAFLQSSFSSIKSDNLQSQTRDANLVIRSDNAYLPESVRDMMLNAGVATASFGRIGDDFGPTRAQTERETFRIVGGLKGEVGPGWRWDAYYQYGQTNYSQAISNNKINANYTRAIDAVDDGTGNIVCRATLSPDPAVRAAAAGCQPLNLFGEFQWSDAARDYAFGTATSDIKLTQHVAATNISGDLFDTWAGSVSLAVGGEYRREKVSGSTDPLSATNAFYVNNGLAVNGSLEVFEGYLETAVPLARDVNWARLLELNGAVRYTHYNTVGGVVTWKLGAVYEPTDGIRFRVTRSRDIRAPNLFELYSPVGRSQAAVRDPSTNVQSLALVLNSGNEDLREETANTFTAGVVLQPSFVPGLRFSADYYNIEVEDVITALGPQIVVNQCFTDGGEICDLITRGPAGIVSVSNPLLNLNQLKVRGIDFEAQYRINHGGLFGQGGSLILQGVATRMIDLTTVDITGTATDRAGMNGSPNGQTSGLPTWSLNAQATWEEGPVSFTTQVRYLSPGKYDVTLVGPTDAGYSPTLNNSISINDIPAETYVNLQLQFTVREDGDKRFQLYGAVNNLLDNDPPNYLPSSTGPTNAVLYDVVGRSFRVGARVTF